MILNTAQPLQNWSESGLHLDVHTPGVLLDGLLCDALLISDLTRIASKSIPVSRVTGLTFYKLVSQSKIKVIWHLGGLRCALGYFLHQYRTEKTTTGER